MISTLSFLIMKPENTCKLLEPSIDDQTQIINPLVNEIVNGEAIEPGIDAFVLWKEPT